MFTRALNIEIDPTTREKVMKLWRDHATPILQRQRGFMRGYALTNSDTGKGVVICIWKTKYESDNFENSSEFEAAVSPFRQYFIAPPSLDFFRI
ncbi:MAG: antibiotic biosynthesis monooxygenase [Chloroflexi bacterium]|uniref:Antibiotic biosynthesis monooxygenase n=1 Tax=Candidatus Chlorohelix allophototropha TaxID=3003348 RepID=A0A8T7M9D5_9CHLR|nr:antibiotic biosynthesis monooxygenase [Chloroflexota bacterium]WJW68591.1 antibiotic biosynthesis monooxygenase [Chloroflexota bacterium L227-S17]